MATVAQCFCGQVEEREYAQVNAVEMIPTYLVDGVAQGFTRHKFTTRTKEQTFRFEGLTDAQAHSTASVAVSDVSGTSYTVPMAGSVTDGSEGSAAFEIEVVEVSRRRISPHMWEVVVTRRGSALYDNGTKTISAPSWAGL